MTNYFKKSLLFILCWGLYATTSLFAQIHFTATVSPASIGKNETAELKFIIENASEANNFIAPSLKDFIILSGPNQESGMENNNGVTKQYIALAYIIKPRTKGNFTIGPALAKVDGKPIKTNTIKLKVTNATSSTNQQNNNMPFGGLSGFFDEPVIREKPNKDFILKEGENIADKIKKNIFLKVLVDKTSCYIGEPIVVAYKLYSRLKSESSITKNPYLNGFSVIDLIQAGTTAYNIEKINGREYNVYTLRKAQLYPLQSGTMEVEIAEVENTIHFIKEAYLKSHAANIDDAINGMPAEAMQEEKITLQTKPVTINVKPLPDTNKPVSFRGAVGNFKIEAAVEKDIFSTDESGKLQIIISGDGNMELMNAPEVNFPDSIESFDPTIVEALNKQAVPVSGQKSYVYNFNIKNAGRFTIPAIEYSFFDTHLGKYSTITTAPIAIVVTKGLGKASRPLIKAEIKNNKNNFLTTTFNNLYLLIFPVIVFFIGLFFWFKKKGKKKTIPNLATKEKTLAAKSVLKYQPLEKIIIETPLPYINPLAATKEMLNKQDSRGFYETLNRELKVFFSKQLNITEILIDRKSIAIALDKKKTALNISLQIDQLLQQIEWQLYTPFSEEDKMEEIYQEACSIIENPVLLMKDAANG